MIGQFINFIWETNIISAILLCLGFIVLALGFICPLANYLINILWSVIDESKINWDNYCIDKVLKSLPKIDLQLEIHETYNSYSIYSRLREQYRYKNKNKWQHSADYDTKFYGTYEAEAALEELNSSSPYDYGTYVLLIIGAPIALVGSAIAFNYFFWPMIYLASTLGSVYILMLLRRLQKKAIKLAEDFKKHTELESHVKKEETEE